MYLYVELWKARPEWLALSKEDRLDLFSEITLQWLNERGVNLVSPGDEGTGSSDAAYVTLLGSAINQAGPPHNTDYRWFAVWTVPDRRTIRLFEERVEQLGWWYDFFEQVNGWGKLIELKDQKILVNDMTKEDETLTQTWLEADAMATERDESQQATEATTLKGKIDYCVEAIESLTRKIDRLVDALEGQQPGGPPTSPRFTFAEIAARQTVCPPEMNQLKPFLGRWSGMTEAKMVSTGEVMRGPGTREMHLGIGGRYLVGVSKFDMGQGGHMETTEFWTWDAAIKKFRTWYFHNWGMTGTGTAEFDPTTGTWREQDEGYNTVNGGKTRSKMTTYPVDENTIHWERSEYDDRGTLMYTMRDTNRRLA
jgi:hypothetical protein